MHFTLKDNDAGSIYFRAFRHRTRFAVRFDTGTWIANFPGHYERHRLTTLVLGWFSFQLSTTDIGRPGYAE